jgi:hypothetical protein
MFFVFLACCKGFVVFTIDLGTLCWFFVSFFFFFSKKFFFSFLNVHEFFRLLCAENTLIMTLHTEF